MGGANDGMGYQDCVGTVCCNKLRCHSCDFPVVPRQLLCVCAYSEGRPGGVGQLRMGCIRRLHLYAVTALCFVESSRCDTRIQLLLRLLYTILSVLAAATIILTGRNCNLS